MTPAPAAGQCWQRTGIFMVFVDVNIVNMRAHQKVFRTGEQGLQWAVAGWRPEALAAVLMSCALLGSRHGRRRSLCSGSHARFVVSSIVCVLPVSLAVFTVARVVRFRSGVHLSALAGLQPLFPNPNESGRYQPGWP